MEPSSKNSYKLDSDGRRYSDHSRNHTSIISPNSNENDDSRSSNFKKESSTKYIVLTAKSNDSPVPKSNDSRVFTSNNSPTSKSKRNVCIQTSGRHRSHKRSSKYVENSEKENLMIPVRISSSKDVTTIFKVNDADFNDRKSKTNLKELKTRHKVKKTTNSKTKKRIRKTKEHDPEDVLKNVRNAPSIMSINEENMSCHFGEDFSNRRSKNSDRFSKKNRNKPQTTSNFKNMRTSEDTICKSTQLRSYKSCSSTDSIKVANATRTPRNYFVENKTSEIMILGNIKKRLEEDYDEYFSVNEIDLEDLVEPETPRKSWTNQRSALSSETRTDQYSSKQSVRTSRSMLMMAKYQESQNHVWHSTLHSIGREESEKRSIRASLSYNSAHCSNLDLVRSQSSYYHSVREDACTPSSSAEYCSASSVSVSKFHSSLDNSIDAALQTCSLDTDLFYDCNFNHSTGQTFLSTDISFEDKEIDKTDKEFLNETVVNSFTVCCCQTNSTPNFSNSSRRVSESLDSGILTDYSRDCLRASEERLKRKKRKKWEKLRCGERKMDLQPTYDFNTDSSCSDGSLDRRVDVAVKKFTENLILTERKVKVKLRRLQNPARLRQERKRRKGGRQVGSWSFILIYSVITSLLYGN